MKTTAKRIITVMLAALLLAGCAAFGAFAEEVSAPFAADTSWYDPNDVKTEYTLTTAEQLAGMATLIFPAADQTPVTFEGVTVKLGNDIIMNYGKPEDWVDLFLADPDKFESMINWADYITYVGNRSGFMGTFDGQGHYISGLYASEISTTGGLGLFERTTNATIKNLSIVNSYIEGNRYVGALIGVASGITTIENVYVNVNLSIGGTEGGGLIGAVNNDSSETKIKKVVVEGSFSNLSSNSLVGGLIGNAGNKICTVECEDILIAATLNGKKIAGISANQYEDNTVKLNRVVLALTLKVKSGDGNYGANLLAHVSASVKNINDTYTDVYTLNNGAKDNGESKVTCQNGGTAAQKTADELKALTLTGWSATDSYPVPTACKAMRDAYAAAKDSLINPPAPATPGDEEEQPGNNEEQPGNNDQNPNDNPTVTDETTTETPKDNNTSQQGTDSTGTTQSGGCASTVFGTASILLTAILAGVAMKKKHD